MVAMITFADVTKRYPGGIIALDGVSVDIQEGEFVFVTGPSGAGKTTLIRLLLAQEKPSSGQVLVARRNVRALRESSIPFLRRNIGVVFQDFRLIDSRTVFENIAVTLEVLGLPQKTIRTRVTHIMDLLGLGHLMKSYPPMLSGGEQQRVAIARAVVNDPPLIVADEPTGNLDPALSVEVMDLLKEANGRGATVIVATHSRELMERYRTRCIYLERGQKVDERMTGGDAE